METSYPPNIPSPVGTNGEAVAVLHNLVDRRGRAWRIYASAARPNGDGAFKVVPGASVTIRVYGKPRGRGRPPREQAWFVAVKAAQMISEGARLRDVHEMINKFRRFAGREELADPLAQSSSRAERPHHKEAARWGKAGRRFRKDVRRRGYLEVTWIGSAFEAWIVKDGVRRPAAVLLNGRPLVPGNEAGEERFGGPAAR